jgi:hypothetical protein
MQVTDDVGPLQRIGDVERHLRAAFVHLTCPIAAPLSTSHADLRRSDRARLA